VESNSAHVRQTYGCRILVRNPQENRPSGRDKRRREDITCFRTILGREHECVHWIYLTQNTVHLTIFCADGEEPSAFIKGERFTSCMGDSPVLKKTLSRELHIPGFFLDRRIGRLHNLLWRSGEKESLICFQESYPCMSVKSPLSPSCPAWRQQARRVKTPIPVDPLKWNAAQCQEFTEEVMAWILMGMREWIFDVSANHV